MSLSASIIRELVAAGLSGEALVAACERIEAASSEADNRSASAIRQARYRERKRNESVTSYVTLRNAPPLSSPPLPFPEPLSNSPPIIPPTSTSLRSVSRAGASEKKPKIEIHEIEGVSKSLLADWKSVRKAKRAGPVTESVIKAMQREADRANITLAYAVQLCAERGWQGFQADYKFAKPEGGNGPPGTKAVFLTPDDLAWQAWVDYRKSIGAPKPAPVSSHRDRKGYWFPTEYPPKAGSRL